MCIMIIGGCFGGYQFLWIILGLILDPRVELGLDFLFFGSTMRGADAYFLCACICVEAS